MPGSGTDDRAVLLVSLDSQRKIWGFPEGAAEEIEARFPKVHIVRAPSAAAMREHLPMARILYAWNFPREVFPLARRLAWIHTPAAGVDHLLYPQLRNSNIILTNCRGIAHDAMADHLFAMMLALARRLPEVARAQAQQSWIRETMWRSEPTPSTLSGKTLGIIGLGGVGTALAHRARAFGMTIVAVRRSRGKAPKGISKLLPPEGIADLLAESDFVALTVPLTHETRGLIGAKELRRMKKTAYLLNVGRGEQIDEGALIRALREGWIAGAALDVFQQEPLPKNSVLWRIPGLLITPHYAGTYPEHMARATDLLKQNLALFLAGKTKKLKNIVDKKIGY